MLIQAIDAEVSDWIKDHVHLVDSDGRRQVVRNGRLPERQILTGLGSIGVRQPRVHDRRPEGSRVRFHSRILPPYLRKSKTIDELISWLYLKGISTGDMAEAWKPWSAELINLRWLNQGDRGRNHETDVN